MNKNKAIAVSVVAVLAVAGIGTGIFLKSKNNDDIGLESSEMTEISVSSEHDATIDITAFQLSLDNVISENEQQSSMPLFLSSMDKACKFKVLSVSESDDGFYLAKVDVTYADVSEKIKEYMSSLPAEQPDIEKLNKDISEIVSNADRTTEECEIYFVSENDTYKPIFSEELIDKIYGGIYSAYYEQLEKLSNELKGGN